MRAAAILGLGCSSKDLRPFQSEQSVEWLMGMPASGEVADVVLLFGGDGTVHRHLGQLVRLGLPVLVVPAGSGNDFARSLGLRRVRDSLAAWRKFCGCAGGVRAENVRAIDLGVIAPSRARAGLGRSAVHATYTSILLLCGRSGARWGSVAASQPVAALAAGARWVRAESGADDFFVCPAADEGLHA